MANEEQGFSTPEGELQRVLADYLKAVEANETPNQQELLARHPELGDELRAFFAEHDEITRLAEPFLSPGPQEGVPVTIAYTPHPQADGGDRCSIREDKLQTVIAEYLKAVEANQTPNQQELLARHPELADELRAFFAEHDEMMRLAEPFQADGQIDGVPSTVVFHAPVPSECGERYSVQRYLTRGGMGEIWLAEDHQINRQVAIKKLRSDRPELQDRFGVEAQITGQLEHPAIVPVHDFGQDTQGRPFYVMKFVRGRTLKEAIRHYYSPHGPTGSDREVEWKRLLKVFVDLCQAVAFAHSRGVVHRDIKPDNVMLGSYGETLVLDWGLAKALTESEEPAADSLAPSPGVRLSYAHGSTETRGGSILGAPPYMSPEMAEGRGAIANPLTDVYLLGATLYEILTSQPPRRGASYTELVELARTVDPLAPRKINRLIPPPLEAICLKAIAHFPEDRYPTAQDLARDVERFLAGEPVSVYRERIYERAWRWMKRHRQALGRSVAAILVAGAILFGYAKLRQAQRLEQQETARQDVSNFRYLKDQTQFYIGGTDTSDERVPYYDFARGEASAQNALAVLQKWGDQVERLPLQEERGPVKEDLYELLLLRVQAALSRDTADPKQLLAWLEQAAALQEPSRSYYRLQAHVFRALKEETKAVSAERLADDPATRSSALDYFLAGEKYRMQLARPTDANHDAASRETKRALLEKAIKAYYEALESDPRHYWSHLQLGRCYLSLGRGAEAVEAFTACIALRPAAPWGYSTRGLAWALLGHFADAERDLQRTVEEHPDFLPARLNYGVALWLQGEQKYAQALEEFAAVSRGSPGKPALVEAAFCRGQIFLELGKLDPALQEFDYVVAQRPGFLPVYTMRAKTCFLLHKDKAGLEDLTTLAGLEAGPDFRPESPQAYAQRGRYLLHLGAELPLSVQKELRAAVQKQVLDLSLQQLQKAVELGSRSADLFDDLGVAFECYGRVPDAIQAYSQGLELAPDHIKLHIKRGWAYLMAERYNEGQADCAWALEHDPANPWARAGLGYANARLNAPAAAGIESLYALLNGAEDHLVLHNLACIQVRLALLHDDQTASRQDLAVALLQRAVARAKQQGAIADELEQIRREPDFDSLRSRPDFQQLLDDSTTEL